VNPLTAWMQAHRALARGMTRGSPKRRLGPPTIADGWSRDPLRGWARKDAALTDTESIDYATVDVTGLARDSSSCSSRRRTPRSPVSLMTVSMRNAQPQLRLGLNPAAPEVGVEGDLVTAAQQPGAITAHGSGGDPAAEDDLHLLRSADIEVVGAQRIEKSPGMARCVEDDGRDTFTWRIEMSHQ
jgi:hypothetical protein